MIYFKQVMFLAAALNNLRNFEPNSDRQKKLAETLKTRKNLLKSKHVSNSSLPVERMI